MTTSLKGVIFQGQSFVDVPLAVPPCPAGKQFLVQGVHVGPEVVIGSTQITVVDLPKWAVSVPVYQTYPTGQEQVALVAIGNGAEHIWASIPAGQSILLVGDKIIVRIVLLGGTLGPPAKLTTASQRFEFNVHVWGCCGEPFISPP
ncbi:MAG: hypothetical protein ACHQ03_09715 [Candidatus Bathyarchaeia archaeon]